MPTFEVFNYGTGVTVITVWSEVMAARLVRFLDSISDQGHDYAPPGEGWV